MYSNSVFSRKFSLSDLVYAASGYRQDDQFQLVSQFVVEGQGKLEEPALESAIVRVAATNPACRARLAGLWGFKRWRADGTLPRIRTVYREWDGQYEEGLDFIDTPLDLIRGPIAELVQVIGQKTWLVFRIHHAVTDGVGLIDFVTSLFDALNGQEPEHYYSRITLENMPEGNLHAIPSPVRDAPIPFRLTELKDATDRSRIWQRITVPGKDSRILLRTILALAKATNRHTPGSVRVHVPVNLRRHLPKEKSSANLIGMIRLDVDEDETLRSLVKKFSHLMDQKQELPIAVKSLTSKAMFWIPLWLLRALEKRIMTTLLSQARFRCSGTVSSLGFQDLNAFSCPGFKATSVLGIPVPPLGTPLMLVIISNEHQSELVISASRALASPNELNELADSIVQGLQSVR